MQGSLAPFAIWASVATLTGCAAYAPPRDPTAPLSRTASPTSLPLLQPTSGATRHDSRSAGPVILASHQKPDTPVGKPPQPLPAPRTDPQPTKEKPATPNTGPTRLTLDQVINAVLVSDPQLRAGFEAINQANAEALTASLRPNPSLFTDIQLLPLTRPFTPFKQGGPPQFDTQVTYPIDWYLFGKRAARMVVAARGVRASEAEFEDLVRRRVAQAASGYFDVLEAGGLLALAQQDLENLGRIEAATAKAVAAGGKTQIELNRIRLDLAHARMFARETETSLVSAKAALRAMIGRSEADPTFDVAGVLDGPLDASLPAAEEGFALALKNRPDLRAQHWKVEQARAGVESERRHAYPTVAPMFGYTRQFQRKAIGFPDANSWVAAATVSLPFFDRNQGGRARASSALAQSQFQYDAAVAAIRAEVETAARQYKAARATATDIASEQLKLALDTRDAIAQAYHAGGRPLIDLLDSEQTLRDTYRAYVTSRASFWRAVYRYRSAIGQQTAP